MADIPADSGSFENQVVRIEGFATGVCRSQGCYLKLEDPQGQTLDLEVIDGAIDFGDFDPVGHYAIGEGVSQQSGEHGAQVYIQDHGALLSPDVCTL